MKESNLRGLVILNSLVRPIGGMNRSIILVDKLLKEQKINLNFWVTSKYRIFFIIRRLSGKNFHKVYDFVLFNSLASLAFFPRWLVKCLEKLSVPIFIYWHETDWVLERWEKRYPIAAQRLKLIACKKSVIHLTVSEACTQAIRDRYPTSRIIQLSETSLIPSPYDIPLRPSFPPLVVNVASIQERKGTDLFVETAIKVCQQHPTVKFIWLGRGASYGTWRADIKAAGLEDRILFPGYLEEPYVFFLRRASVFFLSSRDDPFPLAVLEAMCLGRTVVTFDVGGAPEALAGHGIVIQPFDTDAAASAILRCLHQSADELINPELRKRYLELYAPEQLARRMNACIRQEINGFS